MPARSTEGLLQFQLHHVSRPLDARMFGDVARTLSAWREVLARLRLIGRHPARYEGLGYGNASARVGPFGDVGRGRRRFLVTGTQTSGLPAVGLDHFALVERYDLARNEVASAGAVSPSSEALTHAALYDVGPAIRCVLHAHAPEIWRNAARLGIPVTRPEARNGTPEMAAEVQRLHRESALTSAGILAMGGHEDGVLTLGASAAEAGQTLVRHLARALAEGDGA